MTNDNVNGTLSINNGNGANVGSAISAAASNEQLGPFSFSGRARRSSYWKMVVVSSLLIGTSCGIVAGVAGNAFEFYGIQGGFEALGAWGIVLILVVLPVILWSWAVQVRRCHDLGWSGWVILGVWLIGLIPVIGWIATLIFTFFLGFVDGQPFTNIYAPDPKGRNVYHAANGQPTTWTSTAPATSAPTQKSMVDQLRELKKLLDEGILTEGEFATQKAKVLSGSVMVAEETNTIAVVDVPHSDGDEPLSSISLGNSTPQMIAIPGKSFSISKYPVTQELWELVMEDNPSAFKGANRPVENVSWHDCQKFLEKLNALSEIVASGRPYRLPTEEEWKFACLAGSTVGFCRLADGSEITKISYSDVAWHSSNSENETHPVGQKKPNAFGLYDMLGNVWEWTSTKRMGGYVDCGGSFGSPIIRADACDSDAPDAKGGSLGFRLARDIA